MKILKALYERFVRLVVSVCYQIPWVLAGIALHFYAVHTFPQKIQNAFGIIQAQADLNRATESAVFMKNMISVSNPIASVNYLTSLIQQTMAWSRLNFSQMFATIATSFSLWFIDIFLFLGGVYLIWRVYKTYRQKGRQKENALLVSKELAPYFKQLQDQIQILQEEIHNLKEENGKSRPVDSFDSGS